MAQGDRWTRAPQTEPRIWRRCAGRSQMNGVLPRFTIQDVPEDMHEEVVTFMSKFFTRDEPISGHTQLWLDPTSLQELQNLWRATLRQRVAVVAILDGASPGKRVVGANVLAVCYKADRDNPNPYKGTAMRIFVDALNYHNTVVDPYDKFGVDEAMVGLGLSIDPAFRGQGLGLEILRARFDLGRAVGLRMTYTVFTAIQSQTLGARVGMATLNEEFYKDYKDSDGKKVLEGISFPASMRLQARTIE